MGGKNMTLIYTVNQSSYTTVKEVLLSHFGISHRLLTKLKRENAILLNHVPCFVNEKICEGDRIEVCMDYVEENDNIIPTSMPLSILKETEGYLIVNKPAHMPVHPSCYHFADTLSNGIRFYFDSIGLKKKIRPVNRLDADTTGIVIFAKNEYVQENFIRQMKQNTFQKYYLAITEGFWEKKKGIVDKPIARKEGSIMEREISPLGESAITHYEVLQEYTLQDMPISILLCKLETGRTHQIRVHLSSMGHPLLGDSLYGGNTNWIGRQALHSYQIEFLDPITHKKEKIQAPIPEDMLYFLQNI